MSDADLRSSLGAAAQRQAQDYRAERVYAPLVCVLLQGQKSAQAALEH
jgi:hypothetical protein